MNENEKRTIHKKLKQMILNNEIERIKINIKLDRFAIDFFITMISFKINNNIIFKFIKSISHTISHDHFESNIFLL